MKYLLVYRGEEGDYLISSSNSEEEVIMLYFFYSYREIKNLKVLETTTLQLPLL